MGCGCQQARRAVVQAAASGDIVKTVAAVADGTSLLVRNTRKQVRDALAAVYNRGQDASAPPVATSKHPEGISK